MLELKTTFLCTLEADLNLGTVVGDTPLGRRVIVDVSGAVWKGQPVEGVAPPVSPVDLAQFQRASVIRDLFFGAGGNTPSLRFDLTPKFLDGAAKEVTLEFDPGSNVVEVCVRRLRKKLGPEAPIETVRHAGYRLAA